jgi:hypothetical protein
MFRTKPQFRLLTRLTLCALGTVSVSFAAQLNKSSTLSEQEARKLITDSPWAKRSKLRSTAKAPTSIPPMEDPGTKPGGLGPGGPGHGVVVPSAEERIREMNGPRFVPCLGWGIGSKSLLSPTSDECKAAWKSTSIIAEAGVPPGFVAVLWESATPIRAAKERLEIPEADRADDEIIISVFNHSSLNQINPAGSMKPMIMEGASLLRNGKIKVGALDVSFIERAEQTIVRFYFPRRAIQPGDKDVTFRYEILDSVVEAKFTLKEMLYQGQLAW